MPETDWDYDVLWQKSKLFMDRALKEDRTGATFALWSVLALETLARATLANVHPALLADPRDGENVMYAFGYGAAKNPRSIQMSTVLKRCQTIIPQFTDEHVKFTSGLMERRNAELHTGKPAFEDFPVQLWLARYYTVVELLLDAQGRTLDEFLGESEAAAAGQMVTAAQTEIRDEVFGDIKAKREAYDESEPSPPPYIAYGAGQEVTRRKCPACGNVSFLLGEIVTRTLRAKDDAIVESSSVLPTRFECQHCSLRIDGHTRLHAADMGGQFTAEVSYDPAEYYGIEFDIADYLEPEYGND